MYFAAALHFHILVGVDLELVIDLEYDLLLLIGVKLPLTSSSNPRGHNLGDPLVRTNCARNSFERKEVGRTASI